MRQSSASRPTWAVSITSGQLCPPGLEGRPSRCRGYNPYEFGMAGGSDSHNTGSPYRQDNFYGLHADADGSVERRSAGVLIGGTMGVRLENPGGRVGGGENLRFYLGRDVPQGNLRRQRPAHQSALLRWLGLRQGPRERRRLG